MFLAATIDGQPERPTLGPLVADHEDTADRLDVSVRTLFAMRKRGELRTVTFGRITRIPLGEIARLLSPVDEPVDGPSAAPKEKTPAISAPYLLILADGEPAAPLFVTVRRCNATPRKSKGIELSPFAPVLPNSPQSAHVVRADRDGSTISDGAMSGISA